MSDIYVSKTATNGLGVYAGRKFLRGELIMSVTGSVLENQTEHSYQIGFGRHLDPDSPGRYINHACEPNAGVKTDKETGFPDIYAMRNIETGEEIKIDYAMTEFMHYPRKNPEDEFDLTCRCEKPSCRGKLGYYSELAEEIKKSYKGFISDYLVEWDMRARRR